MGIEGIEISKLSGKLQQLASAADDGNGVIENTEIEIFKNYAETAVKNGQVSEADYKAIFGSEIKQTSVTTNPKKKTYTKAETERMERNVVNILNEEYNTTPNDLLKKLTNRLGVDANDEMYKDLQGQVTYIMNAINQIGYNSKDDVEDLEKKVKDKLHIGRKDDYAKDVLKALIKNAEYVQTTKEFNEIKEAYDKLVDSGVNEELAFDQVQKEFKSKGSYYKDIVKNRGSWIYKMTHFKSKMSKFESSYIMPEARETAREAVYESDSKSSKQVKKDAKATLKEEGDYNKYTKKALRGENGFKEWVSGEDSDMKVARKNHATYNNVMEIRENGLSEDAIIDAIDERSTFGSKITFGLFFKKKTNLFEALKNSGLIVDKGDGTYDVKALSELIGLHVGDNYKLDRQSAEFKALAEKTKTTSALAAATELKNLTPQEAKMLVEMCGYRVEGKDWGKAILGATVGALVSGLGGAAGAATNKRPVIDTVITNSNHLELNLKVTGPALDEIASQFEGIEGATMNLIEGGIQIIVDQKNVVPLFWKASRHILATGLKSSIIGAAAGLIAGLKDSPEKPITSTQFECTSIEEYEKVLANEVKQNAVDPKYKDALMMIAATFIKEDENGNKYWDCDGYKMFLNQAAGNGGILNREELLGALERLKREETIEDVDDGGEETVVCENCDATKGKENDTYADVKIPTIKKSEAKTWAASAATFYPCLVQAYGPGRAAQLLKAAQAVTDGDYSAERLLKLVRMSVTDIRKMDEIEGFDKEYYIGLRLAEDLPDNVFVPDSIAGCDKKQNVKVGKVEIEQGGKIKAPSTDFTGYKVKTADGREYVDFCDGSRTYIPEGKTAEDVCQEKEEELRKQGQNVKINLK